MAVAEEEEEELLQSVFFLVVCVLFSTIAWALCSSRRFGTTSSFNSKFRKRQKSDELSFALCDYIYTHSLTDQGPNDMGHAGPEERWRSAADINPPYVRLLELHQ